MLELTPWQPALQARDAPHQAIAAAVRWALPSHAARQQASWDIGERHWKEAPAGATQAGLLWLEWHLQEGRTDCAGRAVGYWRFRGKGTFAEHPVEFNGAYLRDLRSGAFREFQMDILGLPKNK